MIFCSLLISTVDRLLILCVDCRKKGRENIFNRHKESKVHNQSSLTDHVLEVLRCRTNCILPLDRLPETVGVNWSSLFLCYLRSFLKSGRRKQDLNFYLNEEPCLEEFEYFQKSGMHWNRLSYFDFLRKHSLKWQLHVISYWPCPQYQHS